MASVLNGARTQGIVAAYRRACDGRVLMSGPTHFAPIIDRAAAAVGAPSQAAQRCVYVYVCVCVRV